MCTHQMQANQIDSFQNQTVETKSSEVKFTQTDCLDVCVSEGIYAISKSFDEEIDMVDALLARDWRVLISTIDISSQSLREGLSAFDWTTPTGGWTRKFRTCLYVCIFTQSVCRRHQCSCTSDGGHG